MKKKEDTEKVKDNTEGYPLYPASEDVYTKDKEEKDIDPEDITKKKESSPKVKAGKSNEKDFAEDETGEDLDVPGSEDDEKEENAGSEDEENNYYSLGGDDHNDLDEDKGE
ncbi:MAG TPA: hypothetical protein VK806_13050 [Bacteroidia bacterium]|jgi:hypothetical protein|nr:hypothetical protein [Bacteroidia bacterium]